MSPIKLNSEHSLIQPRVFIALLQPFLKLHEQAFLKLLPLLKSQQNIENTKYF